MTREVTMTAYEQAVGGDSQCDPPPGASHDVRAAAERASLALMKPDASVIAAFACGALIDVVVLALSSPIRARLVVACMIVMAAGWCLRRRAAVTAIMLISSYWVLAWMTGVSMRYCVGLMLFGWCLAFRALPLWVALPLWIGNSCMEFLFGSVFDDSLSGLLTRLLCEGFAACVGLLWTQTMERIEHERHKRELEAVTRQAAILNNNVLIASRLHDSLSNELSGILMMAQTLSLTAGDPKMRTDLEFIRDRAQAAFDDTHAVIRQLRNNGDEAMPPSAEIAVIPTMQLPKGRLKVGRLMTRDGTAPLRSVIERTLDLMQSELRLFGLQGTVCINVGEKAAVDEHVLSLIVGLLAELGANLRKYGGADGDGYIMRVVEDDAVLRVTQMNTVRPRAHSAMVQGVSHGQGLPLQRKSLHLIGGSLYYGIDDGVWMLTAEVPLG